MEILGVTPLPGDAVMFLILLFMTRSCWKKCAGRKDVDLFQILFAILIVFGCIFLLSNNPKGTVLENSPLIGGTVQKWWELMQHDTGVGIVVFLTFFVIQALLNFVLDVLTGAAFKKGG